MPTMTDPTDHSDAELLPRLADLIDTQTNDDGLATPASLTEGDTAWVRAMGRWRRGLVTKVALVRVTVAYAIGERPARVFRKAARPEELAVSVEGPHAAGAVRGQCRHCGISIGQYEGLWWSCNDGVRCPDGEELHSPLDAAAQSGGAGAHASAATWSSGRATRHRPISSRPSSRTIDPSRRSARLARPCPATRSTIAWRW